MSYTRLHYVCLVKELIIEFLFKTGYGLLRLYSTVPHYLL